MTGATESLILEILKRMQADMADVKSDIGDLRLRTTAAEEHLATLVMSVAGVNHRLDRFNGRLERIEKRLDLVEGQ